MKKILLTLFMAFALIGCGQTTTTSSVTNQYPDMDYNSFLNITILDSEEQLTQEEDTYYIYIYGSSCGHCAAIKNELLYTIEFINEDKVYIVKQEDAYSVHEDIVEAYNTYRGTDIVGVGTPSLYKIRNGSVVSIAVGGDSVLEVLHSLD